MLSALNNFNRSVRRSVEAFGYIGTLFIESIYWLVAGRWRGQAVRLKPVVAQMVEVGVAAIPIVSVLAFTVGVSLAIELIYSLSEFGAETKVVFAIAKGVTREFGPLITGILVAGRSASALAAKIGSMVVSQEVDALRVMGIMPVRYLATPPLVALLIMLPVLTIIANAAAITGAGLFSIAYLDMSLWVYLVSSVDALVVNDIMQGLAKSAVFGLIIALVGVSCGFSVTGGAEGVGRATTKSVVLAITCLVITDMIFTFFLNR